MSCPCLSDTEIGQVRRSWMPFNNTHINNQSGTGMCLQDMKGNNRQSQRAALSSLSLFPHAPCYLTRHDR